MSQIEPGDREEMLLAGILNGDTTTNIEPATRKEAYLKAILENGGGGGGLPVVTQQDDGKVLTVVNGQWMADSSAPLVDISYANLVELRRTEKLIPGQQYRIIDYETKIIGTYNLAALGAEGYIHYARSTENSWFDIIVTADDASHLNENARAARSDGVDYAPDARPEAWELKYSLDNDSTRFAWADPQHGKGVIYYMRDEHNNSAGYDFKSIQFLRYALKLADATADYTPADFQGLEYNASTQPNRYGSVGHLVRALSAFMEAGVYVNPFTMKYRGLDVSNYDFAVGYAILGTIQYPEADDTYLSTFGADWYYTFDYLDSNGVHHDSSAETISGIEVTNSNQISECPDAIFRSLGESNIKGLPMNVFEDNSVFNNGGVHRTENNTIEAGTNSVTFGASCSENIVGFDCQMCVFGDSSGQNALGEACIVTCGMFCEYNTFSNQGVFIVLANNSVYNKFDRDCRDITFENGIGRLTVVGVENVSIPRNITQSGICELIDFNRNSGNATLIAKTGYNTETAVSTTDGGATWA